MHHRSKPEPPDSINQEKLKLNDKHSKMKTCITIIFFLLANYFSTAQPGKKPAAKEKPPTQKEMEAMMKEAEKMMGEISPEEKKMMDSIGIKMPDINQMKKNAAGISDKQLAEAWEDETRVVPKRDVARIAAISGPVTNARRGAYITSIQSKTTDLLKPEIKSLCDKIYSYIRLNSRNSAEAGSIAAALWIAGKPELSLYVMGKVCIDDPANTDNISNYASILTMSGGQHLAIPLLNNLNATYPNNSTILNNLGQAWFGLGEIGKAEKYLDSTIRIYAYHPQANLTKAVIEEHRGNIEKAREAVKKSMQHSYSKEKEEKLAKLGHKVTEKDFRLPKRTKADPMNLGSFQAPGFPTSVEECIQAEKEWKDFYIQLENKYSQLANLKKQADEVAVKGHQQRMNADMALVKTAMANAGTNGQFISVPMYADRAGKKLKAYSDMHQAKWQAFLKKAAAFAQHEGRAIKEAYDKQMEQLRKEDDEQTGEGKPNKDFCPKYKEASDQYLKSINPKLHEFYLEGLQLQKEILNESAYWYLYIQWPDMYEASKLSFQMSWIGAFKHGSGYEGSVTSFPFVSITQYVCKKQEKETGKTKLSEFDDIACQYNDTMDLKIVSFYNNCSRMTSKFNLKFIEYTRFDDFQRDEGDTYVNSTVKVSVEKGFDKVKWEKGPIKVEAKVGASVEFQFDREGVKDVILGVEAKAGVGHNTYDKGLEEGGSIGGKDVVDTTIEIGVEARISFVSGHGRIGGTQKLEGIKIAQW
jgi:Flp pilus assembly protein TadD